MNRYDGNENVGVKKSDAVDVAKGKNAFSSSSSQMMKESTMREELFESSDRDRKLSQNKSEVMNELTNILNGNRKQKERSLSVNNLYITEPPESGESKRDRKPLNYSRSFTSEFTSLSVYKISGRERRNNNRRRGGVQQSKNYDCYDYDDNDDYDYDYDDDDNDIIYRNNKNLEKSCSLECIQNSHQMDNRRYIEKSEEIFRKPIAPVQKKKMARRSASSLGVNTLMTSKRPNTIEYGHNADAWSEDPSINVLKQQFLEFLKEKKLMNSDLKMKSLDVIRNILPEFAGNKSNDEQCDVTKEEGRNEKAKVGANDDRENARREPTKPETVDGDYSKVKNVMKTEKDGNDSEDVVLRKDSEKAVRNNETFVKRESLVKLPTDKKQDLSKRYSYQGPPSINFATWGERPKTTTRIIIKDEDYVTQETNTTKNKMEEKTTVSTITGAGQGTVTVTGTTTGKQTNNNKNNDETGNKPKEVSKKTQIVIKKPGVLSHYEMFSALPKKKEINSLKLIFMEEEEKKKLNQSESKELINNRVAPVVCGMELKKEFKEVGVGVGNKFSESIRPIPPSLQSQPASLPVASDMPTQSKHSVSVYINGHNNNGQTDAAVEKTKSETNFLKQKNSGNYIIPKRNPTLMPVVKGFRPLNETTTTTTTLQTTTTTTTSIGTANPIVNSFNNNNKININIERKNYRKEISNDVTPSEMTSSTLQRRSNNLKNQINGNVVPLPPPSPYSTSSTTSTTATPIINKIKLKSSSTTSSFVTVKSSVSINRDDSRSRLLDEIRNFGGFAKENKLKPLNYV